MWRLLREGVVMRRVLSCNLLPNTGMASWAMGCFIANVCVDLEATLGARLEFNANYWHEIKRPRTCADGSEAHVTLQLVKFALLDHSILT